MAKSDSVQVPVAYAFVWNEVQRNAALEYFDQIDESVADPALLAAVKRVRNAKQL